MPAIRTNVIREATRQSGTLAVAAQLLSHGQSSWLTMVTSRCKRWPDGARASLEFLTPAELAPVLVAILALSGATQPARAVELGSDATGIVGNLDTTVTLGASLRVQDRDQDLIGVVNGGRANSINVDDGNLNFDKGDLTSLSAKATHELDLNWRNFGFFGRVIYFYDAAIMDIDPERTEFTSEAKDTAGRDLELLDAYGTGDFVIASRPLSVRFGNQVINWGESTFIQNGINIINPVDVTKLRVAGAELRDALEPVLALDASMGLTENLSLEGFWQLKEKTTEIEPAGTFFSTNDFASPGGKRVFLRIWPAADHRRSAAAARL